jgi:hypothetical protein
VEVHDHKIFHTYTVRNNRLLLKDSKAQVEFVAVKITIYISAQRDERQAEFITQYVYIYKKNKYRGKCDLFKKLLHL